MNKTPFATLIFKGARFDEAAMPLESLAELAAYRDLVLSVARALFQLANPARKRLPKGFNDQFRLVLERVERGSTIPVVSRLQEAAVQMDLVGDAFDQARDLVEAGIQAARDDSPLPKELATETLLRFGAFGKTLSDRESIIVAKPGKREGAQYDLVVRRNLLLRAGSSYEENVNLIGWVRGADLDTEGFALKTADGRKVQVTVAPLFMPLALRSLQNAELVQVRGTGVFSAQGTLQKLTDVADVAVAEEDEEIAPGCPTPLEKQVPILRALPSGWYSPDAGVYKPEHLAWFEKLMTGLLAGFRLPVPYLYPTPEGAARAEWSSRLWEVAVTVDLANQRANSVAARVDSEGMDEISVQLNEPGAESRLGLFVQDHLRER